MVSLKKSYQASPSVAHSTEAGVSLQREVVVTHVRTPAFPFTWITRILIPEIRGNPRTDPSQSSCMFASASIPTVSDA
jgi:hypothetical protein